MNTKTSSADPAAAPLRDFLMLPYDQLEQLNLQVKEQRVNRITVDAAREERVRYLTEDEKETYGS